MTQRIPMYLLGFALIVILLLIDYAVYSGGANSVLWRYETPEEIQLQKNIIEHKRQVNENKLKGCVPLNVRKDKLHALQA